MRYVDTDTLGGEHSVKTGVVLSSANPTTSVKRAFSESIALPHLDPRLLACKTSPDAVTQSVILCYNGPSKLIHGLSYL